MDNDTILIGLVKWFNIDKGFGLIGTPDGGEYFLHINSFKSKPEELPKVTPIVFSPSFNQTKNRYGAKNSRLIGNDEDWEIIFDYLGEPDKVEIEVEVQGVGRSGRPYHHLELKSFSLIHESLKYFLTDKGEDEILAYIIDYFDNALEMKYFISYCLIIKRRLSDLFSKEIATDMLNSVYPHFGENLNAELLFYVWKDKRFKLINYNDLEDYEIPEWVLKEFIHEIEELEMKRIIKYSFGPDFGSYYVGYKFQDVNNLTLDEIQDYYRFISFEKESEQDKRYEQLDNLCVEKIEPELIEKAKQLNTVRYSREIDEYKKLLSKDLYKYNSRIQDKVTLIINKIITPKCPEEYKAELWVRDMIEDVPFDLISTYFLSSSMQDRCIILTKLHIDEQFELLKRNSEKTTFESGFYILEQFVRGENRDYSLNLLSHLYDSEFWKKKKYGQLVELYTNYVNNNSTDEQKYELFLKGYVKIVPSNIVYKNRHIIESGECKKIFKNISDNKTEDNSFFKDILVDKVTLENKNSLNWVYEVAIQFLDQENFASFDRKVYDTIPESSYFSYWESGKAKIFPQQYIENIVKNKSEIKSDINKWTRCNSTASIEIASLLLSLLRKQEPITDRIIFYKYHSYIKHLLQFSESYVEQIKQIQNDFYNVILWVLDKENVLDFDLLKQKFIYFTPDEQVRIIRKLFFLKANGQFNLTLSKLDELTRFDLDLYQTSLEFNPDIDIDVSTDIVIKALMSYQQNNRFLVESELMTLVLNNLKYNATKRFTLGNYFQYCAGRQTGEFDWSTEGEIRKIEFGNNQFFFAITLPVGKNETKYNRWGSTEVFKYNPNFENLKEAVKKLPGVKWNPTEKYWGVPSRFEAEVLNFAKQYRFFLDFEGSNYDNNIHLAVFERKDKPNGIRFCEGRLANKPHNTFKKEFWWCAGQPCFSNCETIHTKQEWEQYTLLDFCKILNFDLDETNRMGDYIPKGNYYKFISLINRFNLLLEKLYCETCGHILSPVDTSHFAAHTVVRFHCTNPECYNDQEVYLNHCLNGQCNAIIDSRVSQQCENGLFICEKCGSCCSHSMFERRLSNLQATGGYINPHLIRCVDEKLGHLERGEYFCYICGDRMYETTLDVFRCSHCNVEYDTKAYKFKRPHAHLSNW